jgi:hypothetical protein
MKKFTCILKILVKTLELLHLKNSSQNDMTSNFTRLKLTTVKIKRTLIYFETSVGTVDFWQFIRIPKKFVNFI